MAYRTLARGAAPLSVLAGLLLAGGCGNEVLVKAAPEPGCEAPSLLCEETCVDVLSDEDNCGTCDNKCVLGEVCFNGKCEPGECEPGLANCAGQCVNLSNDSSHCGECNSPCPLNGTCSDGFCTAGCDDGEELCDEMCVDTSSSVAHCGGCNQPCADFEQCVDGTCFGECACNICDEIMPLDSIVPLSVSGTTSGDDEVPAPCGAPGSPETVFFYTAPKDATYRFDTLGSGYDTVLSMYDLNTCGFINCNDNSAAGQTSQFFETLAEGQTVLIQVDGSGGASGPFVLNITEESMMEVCPAVTLPSTVPQLVLGNTGPGNAASTTCAAGDFVDESFFFVAPNSGPYVFSTAGSAIDTVLEIRANTCDGLVVDCDDNGGPGSTSEITVDMDAGFAAVILVESPVAGPFDLSIELIDTCDSVDTGSAVPQTLTGDTSAAADSGSGSCAPGSAADDVYRFTAPTTGVFAFDTSGTPYDTVLHVRDGCDGTELACDDDGGTGLNSRVELPMTAGQTVYVFADGFGNSSGPYTLNITAL